MDEAWKKKSTDSCFDVTMGSYDGAEICELVIYIYIYIYTHTKLTCKSSQNIYYMLLK